MSGYISKMNGKRGGRPKDNEGMPKLIPDISLVILTEVQYETLIERYGVKLIKKAVHIMENWLKNSPKALKHRGKNHYAHFRKDGWVINSAKTNI